MISSIMICCKCSSSERVKSFQIMGAHYVSLCWLCSQDWFIDTVNYEYHVAAYQNANVAKCGKLLVFMEHRINPKVTEMGCCSECWSRR